MLHVVEGNLGRGQWPWQWARRRARFLRAMPGFARADRVHPWERRQSSWNSAPGAGGGCCRGCCVLQQRSSRQQRLRLSEDSSFAAKSGVRSKSWRESKTRGGTGYPRTDFPGSFWQGLHFQIAPLATGFASLGQPVEFAATPPENLPPPSRRRQVARNVAFLNWLFPSQRRNRARSASLLSQSRRSSTVLVGRKPERTSFRHFGRGGSCRDRTNPR